MQRRLGENTDPGVSGLFKPTAGVAGPEWQDSEGAAWRGVKRGGADLKDPVSGEGDGRKPKDLRDDLILPDDCPRWDVFMNPGGRPGSIVARNAVRSVVLRVKDRHD